MKQYKESALNALSLIGIGFFLSSLATFILTFGGFCGNGEVIDQTLAGYVLMPVYVLIVSPILEELLFRLLIFKIILSKACKLDFWIAAGVTSVIFGLLHYPLPTLLMATVLSLMLCYVFDYTGRIVSSIYLHFGFNLFSFCLLIIF